MQIYSHDNTFLCVTKQNVDLVKYRKEFSFPSFIELLCLRSIDLLCFTNGSYLISRFGSSSGVVSIFNV